MLSLKDKVSIITGASSGIGRGTAILFANLGSKLVISGRDEFALNETISKCSPHQQKNVIKVAGDITNAETCQKIVEEAIRNFGKIDILINNAGALKTGSVQSMKIEDYDYLMNVNTRSAIVLTQLCIPYLIEQKGSIVNVSSVAGTTSIPDILAYCVSKSALDQFTKCAALGLASKGVRVNSVNPGCFPSNIVIKTGVSAEEYEKFLEESKSNHPLGRIGKVEECANTIAFLASDLAGFITGELIHIDGGRHIMSPSEIYR